MSIQAWGGEPLLELDSVLHIREWIRPKITKVHISIETNATLLTEEVICRLHDAKIGIGISIDGTRQCHDLQRVYAAGAGTHRVVENNLLLAQRYYGEKLGIITTITKLNYAQIEDIMDYYAKVLQLKSGKFNFVHQSQFASLSDVDFQEFTF